MIMNILIGLAVLAIATGLWFIAESSEWGEIFVAVLAILALAYCVGGIIRWAM